MPHLQKKTNDFGAALLLMITAPLLTEVLPGATRFSSIFVFPIEIFVWGGGALMIRYAVRRWHLGWLNMLLLAFALALAEECIIQQTSLAPLVIRLKGVTYARAFGVNYVYLLWALIYEPTFVVFLSIYLVELIFPQRRERLWISKTGFFIVIPLFLLGSLLAWFSWTHIARTKVFKMPVYDLPLVSAIISLAMIGALIYMALTSFKNKADRMLFPKAGRWLSPLRPLAPWLLGITGALWAVPLFGLVLLGFGIDPNFPPLIAIGGGFVLLWLALFFVPKWAAHQAWRHNHIYALIFGVMFGSMAIGFLGFIGSPGADLNFKIITNIIAVVLMILLGLKMGKAAETTSTSLTI
jgi:hypothetical protein